MFFTLAGFELNDMIYKNPTMIKQTKEELQKEFRAQLQLLENHSKLYDEGHQIEAKSLAGTLRILLHTKGQSMSLVSQLELESTLFFDTNGDDSDIVNGTAVSSHFGLLWLGVDGKFIPFLDETLPGRGEGKPFQNYWKEQVVLKDSKGKFFTRENIVLILADKDGGAHVDPALPNDYVDLTRNNSLGWQTISPQRESQDIEPPHLASVRQIAHEILRTFLPEYPKQKSKINVQAFAGMKITLVKPATPVTKTIPKVGRNKKCPCKSGEKYRNCHGIKEVS